MSRKCKKECECGRHTHTFSEETKEKLRISCKKRSTNIEYLERQRLA